MIPDHQPIILFPTTPYLKGLFPFLVSTSFPPCHISTHWALSSAVVICSTTARHSALISIHIGEGGHFPFLKPDSPSGARARLLAALMGVASELLSISLFPSSLLTSGIPGPHPLALSFSSHIPFPSHVIVGSFSSFYFRSLAFTPYWVPIHIKFRRIKTRVQPTCTDQLFTHSILPFTEQYHKLLPKWSRAGYGERSGWRCEENRAHLDTMGNWIWEDASGSWRWSVSIPAKSGSL